MLHDDFPGLLSKLRRVSKRVDAPLAVVIQVFPSHKLLQVDLPLGLLSESSATGSLRVCVNLENRQDGGSPFGFRLKQPRYHGKPEKKLLRTLEWGLRAPVVCP